MPIDKKLNASFCGKGIETKPVQSFKLWDYFIVTAKYSHSFKTAFLNYDHMLIVRYCAYLL